jgi:hypothetical protein
VFNSSPTYHNLVLLEVGVFLNVLDKKSKPLWASLHFKMAFREGFEPPANAFEGFLMII